MSPKRFPHQAFYAITSDRAPDLARRGDTDARRSRLGLRQHEHEKAIGVELAAAILYPQELAASSQSTVEVLRGED